MSDQKEDEKTSNDGHHSDSFRCSSTPLNLEAVSRCICEALELFQGDHVLVNFDDCPPVNGNVELTKELIVFVLLRLGFSPTRKSSSMSSSM